ncbi:hypothetical protein BDV97DRAFT_100898 [Delphinella strobiligena]|nr:hypothetical protein BDV97DRAFT_100898 [Delphinella strobiligena]
MADTMDIDMDIDILPDPETAEQLADFEAKRELEEARAAETARNADLTGATMQEVDKSQAVPNKININGLDNFTTQDIRQFAAEYYSTEQLQQRIEWINDTSANLVYNTEEAAAEALRAFYDAPSGTLPEQLSPFEEQVAKPFPSHPDTKVMVRLATAGDVKAPRAHERSRFYLMNPEHDPRERRRDYDDRSRRGGAGRRPERRKREELPQKFDVNMYDDDAGLDEEGEVEERGSRNPAPRDQGRRRRSNNEDLFANKSQGRLRDRSASPVRDGDGRFGFDEDQPRRRTARPRSQDPPPRRRDLNAPTQSSKVGVELFPNRNRASGLDSPLANDQVELFPRRASETKRNRELFPHKTTVSNHRRSDAMDSEETQRARRSLADRITGGPQHGILHCRPTNGSAQSNGFSIKGSAADDAPGFSIRGASRDVNSVVKELFPSKLGAGNSAKEDLFADKMKGRNIQRRRAEDLF